MGKEEQERGKTVKGKRHQPSVFPPNPLNSLSIPLCLSRECFTFPHVSRKESSFSAMNFQPVKIPVNVTAYAAVNPITWCYVYLFISWFYRDGAR